VFVVGLLLRSLLLSTTLIMAALLAIGYVTSTDSAIVETYTSEKLFTFLAGMFIAKAYASRSFRRLGWFLIPGIFGLIMTQFWSANYILWIGLPASAIVIGALGLGSRLPGAESPILKQIGDASYSIYLFHPIGLNIWSRIMRNLPLEGWPQFIAYVGIGLVGSTFAGILIYRFVEKPLTAWLNASTRRISPSPATALT
jgi:exopolysaccharide production protein ExoZ